MGPPCIFINVLENGYDTGYSPIWLVYAYTDGTVML